MPTPNQIITLAKSQVGITEYPPNSNNVVYNTAYYGHNVCDGVPNKNSKYPWCCAFVWWVFNQFQPCLVPKTASCMTMGQWFKDHGQWIEPGSQRVGDVVFYKFNTNKRWTNHVGIVDEVVGKNDIYAFEGNTSQKGSQTNGGAVLRKHRKANIVGYGRPKYVVSEKTMPTLRKGDRNENVLNWQKFLNMNGFYCGAEDGIFGKNTEKAVKEYQLSKGLVPDGIIGSKTWNSVR